MGTAACYAYLGDQVQGESIPLVVTEQPYHTKHVSCLLYFYAQVAVALIAYNLFFHV